MLWQFLRKGNFGLLYVEKGGGNDDIMTTMINRFLKIILKCLAGWEKKLSKPGTEEKRVHVEFIDYWGSFLPHNQDIKADCIINFVAQVNDVAHGPLNV